MRFYISRNHFFGQSPHYPAQVGINGGVNLSTTVNSQGTTGTYSWSKTSGPGDVVFSAPASANTNFSSDTPGVYKVKCEFLASGATSSYTVESGEIWVVGVEVTPSSNAIDGTTSNEFSVNVEPSSLSIDSYQWTWEAPEGSGNNPVVNYSTPNQQTTIVNNAHWYAYPDSKFAQDTGFDCEYTINCEITINSQILKDVTEPKWGVYLPTPAAKTEPPQIDGMPTLGLRQVNGQNQWYVTGRGTLYRTAPEIVSRISSASQFYNKIVTVHEGRHVYQFTTGVPVIGLTLHTLWDADALYNDVLSSLTSNVSEQDLRDKIRTEINNQNSFDIQQMEFETELAEYDAHTQSNAVEPNYLEVEVYLPW
ncbi:MAG: hypothetical protein HY761_07495 [Candidatus Omnitrophica bacterium]|nr:hypothetical protein [Candidatus Omnitrophota bacterium]